MASELFLLPFRPALDANAIVVPGAKLYFYATGTTTPQAIYSDSALTTPLANPVEADAAGAWPTIYLNNSLTYRVLMKDADGNTLPNTEADPYVPGVVDALAPEIAENAAQSALILDILNAIALGVAYANTTDGIAGTVDQEYFGVVSGQRAYVYLNDDGTAVLLYEISTAAVNGLFSAIASVSIAAGEFLHIYNDGGVVTARKAIATLYPANAFALETVLSGASCRCSAFGFNANVSVATMTHTVWLSPTVAGGFTATAPTTEGQFVQPLGMAIPGAGIFFTPQPTVQL